MSREDTRDSSADGKVVHRTRRKPKKKIHCSVFFSLVRSTLPSSSSSFSCHPWVLWAGSGLRSAERQPPVTQRASHQATAPRALATPLIAKNSGFMHSFAQYDGECRRYHTEICPRLSPSAAWPCCRGPSCIGGAG